MTRRRDQRGVRPPGRFQPVLEDEPYEIDQRRLALLEAREWAWRGRPEHAIRDEMERALARRFARPRPAA